MKWFDRILTALRSAARDLISEEDEIEGDRVDTLIDAAQTRLTVLRDELAQAVAREKRAEISGAPRGSGQRARWQRRCRPARRPGRSGAGAHRAGFTGAGESR
jgi:phage shock protein A